MIEMEERYRGMTVNARLFAAGLLGDFDEEVCSGNRKKMIDLLDRVVSPGSPLGSLIRSYRIRRGLGE